MATELAKAYVQIVPSTEGLKGKLTSALSGEASSAGRSAGETAGSTFSGGFGNAIAGVSKVAIAGVTAAATAAGAIVSQAVSSYGEYEQLVGGVETLFGNAADTVIANASNAFKTAGMSANDYMETVTSFSASLLQSLGGDTAKAAESADQALRDMSDNANKMGSSMESIQNAYQGFSKQNYTMLDNLKLGYGGTKTEMERLLADAQELTGVKYDISNLSDVYEAIHAIQQNLGITGTTAKEAASTFQGSLGSVKAAWENVLTGMADKDADLGALINDLVETAGTFLQNMIPIAEQALSSLSTVVSELAPVLAEKLPTLVSQALPGLLDAGVKVIKSLAEGILKAIPQLLPAVKDVIKQLVDAFINLLPEILNTGVEILLELANGIAEALPDLIPTIVDVVLKITDTLIDNVDLIVDGAIALVVGLADGIINALPKLIDRAPEIVLKLADALIKNAPKLFEASIELMVKLGKGLVDNIPRLIEVVPELVSSLVNKFFTLVSRMNEVGRNLVDGIKEGIRNAWNNLTSWLSDLCGDLVGIVKSALKINSPSKVFRDQVGQWIPEGIAVGITSNADSVNDAMKELADGTTTSINGHVIGEVAAGNVSTVSNAQPVNETQDILSALLDALSSVGVYIDGQTAGKLLAGSVDNQLGKLAMRRV